MPINHSFFLLKSMKYEAVQGYLAENLCVMAFNRKLYKIIIISL